MNLFTHSFISLLFTGLIALFPVINPIGSSFMVNPYLNQLSHSQRKVAVKKITFYSFCICIVGLFSGHYILELFGVSIPVVQVAGGITICKMGWDSLSKNKPANENTVTTSEIQGIANNFNEKLFYPLAFPITTGAGTLSVLFTLSAHTSNQNWETYLKNTTAIVISIVIMCLLVFIFYSNTRRVMRKLGSTGEMIVNRISAFLIFCVGLQIAVTGIKIIFHIL